MAPTEKKKQQVLAPTEKKKKKQVLESDPQNYQGERFNWTIPSSKEFQIPGISSNTAGSSKGMPNPNLPLFNGPHNSEIQLYNHGFTETQRNLSQNTSTGKTQSYFLSPNFSRPSPLERYYDNNYFNGAQAMRSTLSQNTPPLASSLLGGTNFPIGNPNDPFVPFGNSTFEVNPNRSLLSPIGYQTELPRTFSSVSRSFLTPLSNSSHFSRFNLNLGETGAPTAPISSVNNGLSTLKPTHSLSLDNLQAPSCLGNLSRTLPLASCDPKFPQYCQACASLLAPEPSNPLVPNQLRVEPPINPPANVQSPFDLRFGQPIDRPVFPPNLDENFIEAERRLKGPRLDFDINEATGEEHKNDNNVIALHQPDAAPDLLAQEIRRVHTCEDCNSSFRSASGLGRHRSAHARARKRALNPPREDHEPFEFADSTTVGLNNNNQDDAATTPNMPAADIEIDEGSSLASTEMAALRKLL